MKTKVNRSRSKWATCNSLAGARFHGQCALASGDRTGLAARRVRLLALRRRPVALVTASGGRWPSAGRVQTHRFGGSSGGSTGRVGRRRRSAACRSRPLGEEGGAPDRGANERIRSGSAASGSEMRCGRRGRLHWRALRTGGSRPARVRPDGRTADGRARLARFDSTGGHRQLQHLPRFEAQFKGRLRRPRARARARL